MCGCLISTCEELRSMSQQEVQIKIIMRYYFIPNGTATIKKADNSKC